MHQMRSPWKPDGPLTLTMEEQEGRRILRRLHKNTELSTRSHAPPSVVKCFASTRSSVMSWVRDVQRKRRKRNAVLRINNYASGQTPEASAHLSKMRKRASFRRDSASQKPFSNTAQMRWPSVTLLL